MANSVVPCGAFHEKTSTVCRTTTWAFGRTVVCEVDYVSHLTDSHEIMAMDVLLSDGLMRALGTLSDLAIKCSHV